MSSLLKVIYCEIGCDIIRSCWPEFKAPVNEPYPQLHQKNSNGHVSRGT